MISKKFVLVFCLVFVLCLWLAFILVDINIDYRVIDNSKSEASTSQRFIIEQTISNLGGSVGYVIRDTETHTLYIIVREGGIIKVE